MNGYFYTLLVASVCGAICSMIAWGGFEKYIKYISSLVCVCLMILPLREIDLREALDSEGQSIYVNEEISGEDLSFLVCDITEQETEAYISQIVFSQFGIKPVYTDIKIDWTLKDPTVKDLSVALSSDDIKKAAEIKEYLSKTLGSEVNIIEV